MSTTIRTPANSSSVRHLAAVLGFAATLAAAGSSAQAQTLRWASQGDLLTLDPHAQNEQLTNAINGQVYEPLVSRDARMAIAPALARSWVQLAPNRWQFQLRPNVRFHDGTAFTAEDVVFSVQRARDATSGIRAYANALGAVNATGPLTVEFVQTQFNPIFLEHLALVPIMSKAWAEKHAAQRPQDFKNKEEKFSATNANGTGPYQVVLRQPDVQTEFRRNEQWWGQFEGNVQAVLYRPVKSDAARTAALLTGDVDLLLDPAPQDLQRLRGTPALRVLETAENRVLFLGMDQARDELLYSSVKGRNPFKDVRVRKALYQAIDIETLRSRLMRGQAQPTGVLSPSPAAVAADPELEKRLPYSHSQARALLAEAGYADGLEFQLDCPNNRYVHDEEICLALAAMWAQVGVKVKVNAMPRALYFPKMEKLDTSMYLLGWGGAITDMETTLTPVLRNRGAGGVGTVNWGNYKNARLDELAAASSKEADPAQRWQLIRDALHEHAAQVHHIPLHRQMIAWAMRENVQVTQRPDNWFEWRWARIKTP